MVFSLGAFVALASAQFAAPKPLGKLYDVGGFRMHLYSVGQDESSIVVYHVRRVVEAVGHHRRLCDEK